MSENFVDKYITDKLSSFNNFTVENFPLYMNGKRVGDGTGSYLVVCSEPFPRNLVLIGLEEGNKFSWIDFAVYDRDKDEWLVFDYQRDWQNKETLI